MYDTDFGSSRRSLAANLALLLGSTLVALALCEVGARLLLPAPQTVKVEEKKDTYEAPKSFERLETQADKSIDSVVLFGGPHGVRLRPNTRGEIRHHVLNGRDVVIEVNSLGLRYPELASEVSRRVPRARPRGLDHVRRLRPRGRDVDAADGSPDRGTEEDGPLHQRGPAGSRHGGGAGAVSRDRRAREARPRPRRDVSQRRAVGKPLLHEEALRPRGRRAAS